MLDHVGVEVADLAASRAFYEGVGVGFGSDTGAGPKPYFWVDCRGRSPVSGAHIAYGAFVLDPDGNNVEAVCHTARPAE